jgi:hypothetical protein
VTYRGRTRREQALFAHPGSRFLPLRHTELSTGPARAFRRHFVEAFVWWPDTRSSTWQLQWQIFEIVRDEVIRIDGPDDLVMVPGERPPSPGSFDVREYATIRVDDDGNAEWAVLKGKRPESRRIESDAERREVRDERHRRDAALKAVDWGRRHNVNRTPALAVADAEGCGFVQVYGWTADRAEAVVVRLDGGELDLSSSPALFDLSRHSMNVGVDVHVYDAPRRQFDFCSDVRVLPSPDSVGPEVWRAVAGELQVEFSPPGIRARNPGLRRATVTLRNVVLRNTSGTTVKIPAPVRLTAVVGSIGG